ncbi:MAG: hypothetical protein RR475_00925 [Clostridia bacterium]
MTRTAIMILPHGHLSNGVESLLCAAYQQYGGSAELWRGKLPAA